jgi:hypothetical protein
MDHLGNQAHCWQGDKVDQGILNFYFELSQIILKSGLIYNSTFLFLQ